MPKHQNSTIEKQKLFSIPCVIFAGGRSSRMGSDKALLPFGDASSLIEFQYRRLSRLFEKVYISTKDDKFDFRAPLILDLPSEMQYAPTAGFVAMFQKLDAEVLFVISVDTPFVETAQIQTLIAAYEDQDAVIAKTEHGIHPICGLYHRRLLPRFEKMMNTQNHRLGQLLKEAETTFITFEDESRFSNLNHPHEYEAACKRL